MLKSIQNNRNNMAAFGAFALALLFIADAATAGTTGTMLQDTYETVEQIFDGYGGKLVAIASLVVGVFMSVARNTILPAVVGICLCIFATNVTNIAETAVSAVI